MPVNSTSISEIGSAVLRLTEGVDGAQQRAKDGIDKDLQALIQGMGGWNIVEVLKTAAACALANGLSLDHPDVALVREQLRRYRFAHAEPAPGSGPAFV
jgi:hypothetical protein